MAEPLVSVIITCYNYGHFLGDALESVVNQTYKNWECIIVDDGSTDSTAKVYSHFAKDERIRYFFQPNSGLSSARNRGLALCKGDWVQFLDADDYLHSQKFYIQLAQAEQYPELDILYTDFVYFVDLEKLKDQIRKHNTITNIEFESVQSRQALEFLFKYNLTVVNSPIVSKSMISKIGQFDPKLRSLEDWDYWTRAALAGAKFCKVTTSPVSLTFVRSHSSSMSTNKEVMLKSRIELFNKVKKVQFLGDKVKDIKSGLKYYCGDIIFDEIQNGKNTIGLKWILLYPFSSFNDIVFFARNTLYSIRKRLMN